MADKTALLKRIPVAEEIVGPTPGQILRRKIFGHRGLIVGGGFLLGIFLIALLAPLLSPHDPFAQSLGKRLLPPIWQPKGTWTYIFGTDPLGRDYLSRLLYGAQVSLLIGLSAAVISGFIGTVLGLAAGYFGGRVDLAITYVITVRLSIPVILVALATVQLVGGSLKVVILVLGLLLWDRFAVVIRSSTMQIRALDYVKSAQAVGCSLPAILFREVLPNVFNQLVVIATLEMAQAILLEAALSFLGVGVQPPTPSWGLMINEGKNFMFFKPYLVMIPGISLFLLVLSINLLGDGVRDVTAPESRS
jgi:peptide/nickel transport system permease protein